jgi:Flp pilus assembly protein TadD
MDILLSHAACYSGLHARAEDCQYPGHSCVSASEERQVDHGLNMLKKASEGSPNNPSILYHLALAYKECGDSAKATAA